MFRVRSAWHAWLLCLACAATALAQLSFDRSEISFAAPADSTTGVVQTIALSASGANLPFTTSIRYVGTHTGWLSVSPSSSITPANLTVTADPTKLSRGLYVAQITVQSGVASTYTTVLLSVGPAPGALSVSPTVLTFNSVPNSSIDAQTLSITSADGSSTQFTASASSSDNWLIVYPFPVSTPASIIVSAIAPPAPGVYQGAIKISPSAGGDVTIVPVVLNVSGSAGTLGISQSALTFNYQMGSAAPPAQPVDLYSMGVTTQHYTATTITPWLRLRSAATDTGSASITGDAPARLTVSADPSGLSIGSYSGAVSFTGADGKAVNVPVALTVAATPVVNAVPSSFVFGDPLGTFAYMTLVTAGSSFTARITPAAPWLMLAPTSGSIFGGSQQFSMLANPTGLSDGNHDAVIEITTFGNGGGLISVPVRLNVNTGEASAQPKLELSADIVTLAGVVGQNNPSQTFDVSVAGKATPHEFTAAAVSDGAWLKAEPFRAVAPAAMAISADTSNLAAGDYEGSVVITSLLTGDTFSVPVQLSLAAPAIAVAPASLTFMQTQRHVAPQPQSVEVTANVPGSFTALSTSKWVTITPSRGSTPSSFSVKVDPTGLPPGSNTGTIDVAGPHNTVSIPVSFIVLPLPAPTTPSDSLTFDYAMGAQPPDAQTIAVNSTDEPVSFAVSVATSSGGKWLVVTPASASTPATISVAVDVSRIIPGTHSGTITLSVPNSQAEVRVINVTLNVAAADVSIAAVLNGASFAPTSVAPGQLISIMGTGLGPFSGIAARPNAAGAIETQLSNVRVLFDGTPAPVLFARADQINAVVPYTVSGRASTRVQVEYEDSLSLPLEVRVVDTAPGIFTATGTGRGQAAALNIDYSANSLANPAARGSTVMLFGTGEGQTEPLGQDGRIIGTDLRHPVLAATATVGGRPAELTYVGSAPGMVSGVFQANVKIPEDVESGAQEIIVIVGGVASQPGVTIAVK